MKWLIIGVAFSLLPIWRVAGIEDGLNFWTYLRESNSEEYELRHIPYDEAVAKAGEAYRQIVSTI